MHTTTWHMRIHVSEQDGSTRAEAVLVSNEGNELRHVGRALRLPGDRDVPEIGGELAVSRALSGLAQQLLFMSIEDVEGNRAASSREPGNGGTDVR